MKILKAIKKWQFCLLFLFSGCFLLIFYFSTLNFLNNLPQNLNYVDVTPNDSKKEDPDFHSFLADGYRSWGVYNLQSNNQLVFNGNVKHLQHYNMDNLELKVWKNETINAQLILIKNDANKIYDNLTIESESDANISVDSKFMDFINARKNRNNSFITSFDQQIADWIKTDTDPTDDEDSYSWTNHLVLPVWITLKASSDIEAGNHPIKFTIKYDGREIDQKTINLNVADYELDNLKDQDLYRLDLWQKFEYTTSYYQQFEDNPIKVGGQRYFELLDPYLKHLSDIGQDIFNFEVFDEFLKVNYENNGWTFDFNQTELDSYLKHVLGYGFRAIQFLSIDKFFDYDYWKEFASQWEISESQIKDGFDHSQQKILKYFDGSSWYKTNRPILYVNYDEFSPDALQTAMDELEKLQGNNKVYSVAADVNYTFWTSDKSIEILKKVDRLSMAYGYLNFMDDNNYNRLQSFVKYRDENNKFTSVYSCTADYPANFVKSQPGESAFIPLFGLKFNIHNFLRWSYNMWPQDWIDGKGIVEADDPSTTLESGDWYSVYPNGFDKQGNSLDNFLSPRIQLLVYGQEQAIKLEVLKQENPSKVKDIISKIKEVYWPDNYQPNWNLFTRNKSKNTSVDKQLNLIISEINKFGY